MSETFLTVALPALTAAVAAPVGAWVSRVLMRDKYRAEVDGLRQEIRKKEAEARDGELENGRKAADILMENIVKPLEKEIKGLRNETGKLRRAIEKIPTCSYAGDCPVSLELRREEATGVAGQ